MAPPKKLPKTEEAAKEQGLSSMTPYFSPKAKPGRPTKIFFCVRVRVRVLAGLEGLVSARPAVLLEAAAAAPALAAPAPAPAALAHAAPAAVATTAV